MLPDTARSERLNRQLHDLSMSVKDTRKNARKLGGYVRTQARRNVRRQQTVEGSPFVPRRKKREQTALLQKIHTSLKVLPRGSEGGVVVSWQNPMEAKIAYRHQHGVGEKWGPDTAARVYGQPDYKAPCTRRQAKALLREGYRLMVPAKGGGRRPKRVTTMWLEKHFSLGQAGVILRMMRTGSAKGVQSWRDTVPERPFLGVTAAEADKMAEKLAKTVLGRVPR
jgi:phage virion morphogenesis protein